MNKYRLFIAVAGLAGCGDTPGPGAQGHTIGAGGGSIVENSGKVALDIPANAVDHDTDISLRPTAVADAIQDTAYELGPDGAIFKARLTVTIAYDVAALPAGSDESALRIYSIGASGVPAQMPGQRVDTSAHTVTAGIAHFSQVYIGYVPQPFIDARLLSETDIEVSAPPGTKILRAHVGACPPGVTCTPHAVGCIDADFEPDASRRPIQTDLQCLYSGAPSGECVGVPSAIHDRAWAAGFYCYRIQHTSMMMEVYSFGGQLVPANPPDGFRAIANPANGSILLTWAPIQPTLGDVSGYYISRHDGRAITVNNPLASQREDTDVTAGATYAYSIYTANDAGFSPAPAQASAVAPAKNDRLPGAPSAFLASIPPGSSGTVALDWGVIDRATSYVVTRASPPMAFPDTTARSLLDTGLSPGRTYTYMLHGKNAEGDGPAISTSVTLAGANSCQGGLQLNFAPGAADLFPGTSVDVAVSIRRLDTRLNITVALSLDPASPLHGLVSFSVSGPNPTPTDSAIHLTQAAIAAEASGTIHVHATDGTSFGTCDVDYPVSAHL